MMHGVLKPDILLECALDDDVGIKGYWLDWRSNIKGEDVS